MRKVLWSRGSIPAAIVAAAFVAELHAGIVTLDSSVDVAAVTISGRRGSVQGPITVDPPAQHGSSGVLLQSIESEAGPVPPSDPPSFPLPGTSGVVRVDSYALLRFARTGRDLTIEAAVASTSDFSSMDGGSYLGNGSAGFSANFVIEQPTQFTLQGQVHWDDEDVLALLRLYGDLVGSPVFIAGFASNGPVNISGTLMPDTYHLETGVAIGEVPLTNVGAFAENGAVELVLTLTPNLPTCPGDTNRDNSVNLTDLANLLAGYGTTSNAALAQGDVDGDGDVDLTDLATLLQNFGSTC